MIKIVSFKICPFVQRVTAMLEAKGVPYDIEYIQLSDKPAWFLNLSPTGQVPLLVTGGGRALFESDAIVEYIDETTAPLQNELSPEDRAISRAWSYQATKHYLVQCSSMQSSTKAVFDERMVKMNKAIEKVEGQLGDGPYFSGDTLGNVDIAWLPLLHRAALVEGHSGYDILSGFPKTRAWQRALLATGIAEASVPEDFSDRFADFYLAERTWLGRGANLNEAPNHSAKSEVSSCCG